LRSLQGHITINHVVHYDTTKHLIKCLFICAERVISTKLEDFQRLGCPIRTREYYMIRGIRPCWQTANDREVQTTV